MRLKIQEIGLDNGEHKMNNFPRISETRKTQQDRGINIYKKYELTKKVFIWNIYDMLG